MLAILKAMAWASYLSLSGFSKQKSGSCESKRSCRKFSTSGTENRCATFCVQWSASYTTPWAARHSTAIPRHGTVKMGTPNSNSAVNYLFYKVGGSLRCETVEGPLQMPQWWKWRVLAAITAAACSGRHGKSTIPRRCPTEVVSVGFFIVLFIYPCVCLWMDANRVGEGVSM